MTARGLLQSFLAERRNAVLALAAAILVGCAARNPINRWPAVVPATVWVPTYKAIRYVSPIKAPVYVDKGIPYTRFPRAVVLGPDNAIWYADGGIVKLKQNGKFTIYDSPGIPVTLTVGADGSIWYSMFGMHEIDQITPRGRTIAHALPGGELADSIVRGSHGSLWFIGLRNRIGERTSDGTFHFYNIQTDMEAPDIGTLDMVDLGQAYFPRLSATPDGSKWLVPADFAILRIDDTGHVHRFTTSAVDGRGTFQYVTPSDDGSVWFWNTTTNPSRADNYVGFLDPTGRFHVFKTPSGPGSLIIDKHGVAWGLIWDYSDAMGAKGLVKITPAGVVTDFFTPENQPIKLLFNGWGGDLWAYTVDKQGNEVFAQVVAEP